MKRSAFFFTLLFFPFVINASMTSGSIDDTYKYARVCHDETCSTYGTINFKPTINANTPGATPLSITDSGIVGHAWGNEVGWINFRPTGFGVTLDPITGALEGTAYANTGGWANFNPTSVSGGTAVDVTINTGGEFVGWAWLSGAYGGWIKFDCNSSATCVKTDWRPVSERPTYGSYPHGGGGGGATTTVANATSSAQATSSVPQQNIAIPQSATIVPSQSQTIARDPGATVAPVTNQVNNNETTTPNGTTSNQNSAREDTQLLSETGQVSESDAVPQYRRVSIFGKGLSSDVRPDCFACLVIHVDDSGDKKTSVLKWNFIPEALELRIPIPNIFSNQNESSGVPPVDIDASSVVATGLLSYGLVRLVFMNIFRLFIPV